MRAVWVVAIVVLGAGALSPWACGRCTGWADAPLAPAAAEAVAAN
jgi:hypothetical protein